MAADAAASVESASVAEPTRDEATSGDEPTPEIWNWKQKAIALSIMIVLYGLSAWASNFTMTSSSSISGSLRPGIAIPIFCGLIGGPWVGFSVGFFGNLFGDYLTGYLHMPTGFSSVELIGAFFLQWQLGNGLIGMIPGIAMRRGWTFNNAREIIRGLGLAIVALVVGVGVASFLNPLGGRGMPFDAPDFARHTLLEVFWPITFTNVINTLVALPILLYNHSRIEALGQGKIGAGLVRRMLITICVSVAVPIVVLGLFLVESEFRTGIESRGTQLAVQLLTTVVLTMVFIVSSALMLGRTVSVPLLELKDAAVAMEGSTLTREQAAELQDSEGTDEIAQLKRTFGMMAIRVLEREQSLRERVQKLEIVIDETKRRDQVQEIVDSDFFKDLKANAAAMRRQGAEPIVPQP